MTWFSHVWVKRMAEYDQFAAVYDLLMNDVDYKRRTAYLTALFKKFDRVPALLLDVACGTGGFSNAFAAEGVEVIAADPSETMLSHARENAEEQGVEVLYLCQSAEELDLYGTVDGAICCMDSLNHITEYGMFCAAIRRIALFLEPERLFIFDLNTIYKHKTVLANHTFVIERGEVYCVWQNSYDEQSRTTAIDLDFFIGDEKGYQRSGESFCERAYTESEIKGALDGAGLEIVSIFADLSEEAPKPDTERVIYVTKKIKENKKWEN